MRPTLWIIGMPLSESQVPSEQACQVLQSVAFVIGENRKVSSRYLKRAGAQSEIYYLDPPRKEEREMITEALTKLQGSDQAVALFSDMGMPLLFDPGNDILQEARRLGFTVRCVPGPTSWGTACALSGWEPPFLLHGFLPRKTEDRKSMLQTLAQRTETIVLMETPYRFRPSLEQWIEAFGPQRQVFLAWEIGNPQEVLEWCSLGELSGLADRKGLEKGEFVLLVRGREWH